MHCFHLYTPRFEPYHQQKPTERVEARTQYYEAHAQAQMDSVDNSFMRNNDPRMPMFSEKKSTTSRGGGFGNGTK